MNKADFVLTCEDHNLMRHLYERVNDLITDLCHLKQVVDWEIAISCLESLYSDDDNQVVGALVNTLNQVEEGHEQEAALAIQQFLHELEKSVELPSHCCEDTSDWIKKTGDVEGSDDGEATRLARESRND